MKINNNTQYGTNFGMALRITPEAKVALEKSSMDIIEKFQKAGTELKDTKYWDLEIGKDLTPKLVSKYANSYLPPFTLKKDGDLLTLNTTWAGTELGGDLRQGKAYTTYIKMSNSNAATKAYDKFSVAATDIDQAITLTKILEESSASKVAENEKQSKVLKEIKTAADNLYEQFGLK